MTYIHTHTHTHTYIDRQTDRHSSVLPLATTRVALPVFVNP